MMRAADGASSSRMVNINDVLEVPLCIDTGADCNVVSSSVVAELADLDSGVIRVMIEPPMVVELAGGKRTECRESITVDLRISTAAGPLHLCNVRCLVLENHDDEVLLGRSTLREIGIDVENIMDQLAGTERVAAADQDDLDDDYVVVAAESGADVAELLERMLDDAEAEGFDAAHMEPMRRLVREYEDVWRTRLGVDEPADVEPLRVQLRDGAKPYRSATRKYPEAQRDFLRRYVKELEASGLIYRNNASRWACAAHPVKKQGSDGYRITVDYRPVNQCTVPLAGATPNLRAVTQAVRGAYGFGQFDLFKGFWQLPLASECQELFSFLTEDGVFTPTRVPQGAADSALHFQLQMHAVFRELLYESVLVWIDDVLLFASSPADFIDRLRVFFQILRQHKLKLNASKCKLFAPQVIWCGKMIDGEGVRHDPARLEALRSMPLPPTAAALQNFLCAVNWLRESMVDYARVVGPLQFKLEEVMRTRGRKKRQLEGVDLPWSKDEEAAFKRVLSLLMTSTKTYFAEPTADVCLFTDASNTGWAVVLTQVKNWVPTASVVDQSHEMLVCLSGLFKGAEANWSVIEKEAYPVVRACSDLAYLLERERGFRIYCDHANLVEIFAPPQGHQSTCAGQAAALGA
ncbi:hypothetical protein PINS_up004193 [Pythium insidiosum]|nr:hypothetical protein PINS_up004193 [Pythium insidiosum]